MGRIAHYADVAVEVAGEVRGARRPEEAARGEREALLRKLATRGLRVGLDPAGEACTSEGFARRMEKMLTAGGGRLQFVVGGPAGLAPPVRERLDGMVSLSPMTLTHEMARLLLVEQVYRAFTILRGEPYHR